MSDNDRLAGSAKSLVPVSSSSLRLRRSANSHYPIGQRQQGITPKFALHVLRNWWKIATPAGLLLAAIAVGIVWWSFEKQYEATTWLQIKSQQPFLAFAPSQGERGAGDRFVQTQIEMIRSPLVLAPVIGRPEAAGVPEFQGEDDRVGWLAENVKVSPVGKSELFKISTVCTNAKDSAWIVNAVAHEYLLLLGQDESQRSQEVINTLKEEEDIRDAEVKRLQNSLRERTKQITGEDPFSPVPTTNPNLDHPLADLNSRMIATEVEEVILDANIAALEKALAEERAEIPAALVEEAIDQDPQVRQVEDQISLNQMRLRDMGETLVTPEENVQFNDLQRALDKDKQLLEKTRNDARERIEDKAALTQTAKLQDDLATMKTKQAGYGVIREMLQERYDSKLSEAETVSGDTLELHFLQNELTKAEGVLDVLSQRILRMTTERRAPDQVKLLRPAEAAVVPVKEFPLMEIALASLLFFVPFGLAGTWELLVRHVSNLEQLEESTNVTVIGEVARLPVRTKVVRKGSSADVGLGLAVFEESIDGLRTHLMLSEELKGMKVLAVTSAAVGEGKTSVAAQLAVNMAWVSGKRILLIDGDMRSPDIHSVFGISLDPGLVEILTRDCSVEDAIVRDEKNCTDVLPAGKLRTNPHRLLGNGKMTSFMEEIRSRYDFIIIDTPPILAASESLVLARAADRSLICALQDSSRIEQVRKAHERLAEAGGHPIGIVLNGVPTSTYLYRYGAYSYVRD